MSTLVIEHFKASELPQQWAERLKVLPEQTVTVRIETEATQTPRTPESFVTDDPAFGIWRDREDMSDVSAFVRRLRAARYSPDGTGNVKHFAAIATLRVERFDLNAS